MFWNLRLFFGYPYSNYPHGVVCLRSKNDFCFPLRNHIIQGEDGGGRWQWWCHSCERPPFVSRSPPPHFHILFFSSDYIPPFRVKCQACFLQRMCARFAGIQVRLFFVSVCDFWFVAPSHSFRENRSIN